MSVSDSHVKKGSISNNKIVSRKCYHVYFLCRWADYSYNNLQMHLKTISHMPFKCTLWFCAAKHTGHELSVRLVFIIYLVVHLVIRTSIAQVFSQHESTGAACNIYLELLVKILVPASSPTGSATWLKASPWLHTTILSRLPKCPESTQYILLHGDSETYHEVEVTEWMPSCGQEVTRLRLSAALRLVFLIICICNPYITVGVNVRTRIWGHQYVQWHYIGTSRYSLEFILGGMWNHIQYLILFKLIKRRSFLSVPVLVYEPPESSIVLTLKIHTVIWLVGFRTLVTGWKVCFDSSSSLFRLFCTSTMRLPTAIQPNLSLRNVHDSFRKC